MAEEPDQEFGAGASGGVDPIALALSGASRQKADQLLDEQIKLVRLQAADMEREDSVRHWSLRVRHISDVLKMSFELALAVIGLAIVTLIASAIWNAAEDHGLVVEAFQVPPDLSQRGLTGQVVAAQVLDKLAAMQAATASERPAQTYQNNWGEDLRVEIPETGVSISDLNRFLRQWLGSQTRISGEVFRTQTGLTITARVGADAGDRFSGTDADLERLLQQSAEAIYRRTQPYRLAEYLSEHDRRDESLGILIALADGPPGQDRIWADHNLQFALMDRGDVPGAVARAQDAVRIAPDSGAAWDGLGETQRSLGHDEAALAAFEHALPLSRRNSDDDPPSVAADLEAWQQAYVARYRGDFRMAAQGFEHAGETEASSGNPPIGPLVEFGEGLRARSRRGSHRCSRGSCPGGCPGRKSALRRKREIRSFVTSGRSGRRHRSWSMAPGERPRPRYTSARVRPGAIEGACVLDRATEAEPGVLRLRQGHGRRHGGRRGDDPGDAARLLRLRADAGQDRRRPPRLAGRRALVR